MIRNTRRAAVGLMLAAAFAMGGPVAASASTASTTSATASVDSALGAWTVLRDNFHSFASCESYRTQYAVNYPYVEGSYCIDTAQGNGRYWLWVFYAT